ncbi:MAG: YicC/YloC family endoribonuclease [Neisseria sp.]|nr:YicC/YloC family endoribonuclease [Neisseria sp.]
MLHSMTGFAAAGGEIAPYTLRWELKSVNHRYLDITCRLPEEYRHLETRIRALISAAITRGKVECRLTVNSASHTNDALHADQTAIAALAALDADIRSRYPAISPLSVADILRHPGVLQNHNESNPEDVQAALLESLQQAVTRFKQDRAREGQELQAHLVTRLDKMSELIDLLQALFPQLLTAYMQKTEQRLRDAIGAIEEDRLKQEFALFIQKSDVDEEFSRLRTHIAEVRRIITQGAKQGVGKRLDFLMQELNREANTLGSKAIAIECTQTSVELKVLIEQMREQVQNIE